MAKTLILCFALAGLIFYIVTIHSVSYVEERLADFLRNYVRKFLNELTDAILEEQREAAIKQKLIKPQKIEISSTSYVEPLISSICSSKRGFLFDRYPQ